MSSTLEINNLNYKNIIKDLSLSTEKKQFIAVSGSNKCGKTTLIRMIGGQIKSNKSIKVLDKYLEDYNISDLSRKIRMVIPSDQRPFFFDTLEKELLFLKDNISNKEYLNDIIKIFKLNKYLYNNPNDLDMSIKTKVYLAKALLLEPQLLLIDDLNYYLEKEQTLELVKIIKNITKTKNITVIYTTDNLEEVIDCDYLYILSSGTIILEGIPKDILQKDNVLNKLGLELPFMIDLSVKLRDYDLIQNIELDMDRMVDTLWK